MTLLHVRILMMMALIGVAGEAAALHRVKCALRRSRQTSDDRLAACP
jgi:hypothetical protein